MTELGAVLGTGPLLDASAAGRLAGVTRHSVMSAGRRGALEAEIHQAAREVRQERVRQERAEAQRLRREVQALQRRRGVQRR